MSAISIEVDDLGKLYRYNSRAARSRTLGKAILDTLVSPFGYLSDSLRAPSTAGSLWALRHVSFTVQRAEVLGILGQNGAGKSTLLRILSRITLPTEGLARTHGRVGSLLQIGTGFNYELTGRENIYLNGTILGMKRSEVDRKLNAIVDFSGVERFIDTPIKRYSSGMVVRLGFSVAMFMDPDILLVDEVLSVGDAAFRQKSLEKVLELVEGGCSVLFVSHDLFMIQRLCKRSILFEAGKLIEETDTSSMIEHYLSKITNVMVAGEWLDLSTASHQGTGEIRFVRMRYRGADLKFQGQAYPDGPVEFLLEVESPGTRNISGVSVTLFDLSGFRLINAGSIEELGLNRGRSCVRISIEHLHLKPGTYSLALWMVGPADVLLDQILSAAYMNVTATTQGPPELNPFRDKVTSQVEVSVVRAEP
ncbi:MAG TPA: polysaccharide ABC transporter ATP-binding protein [Anaerolineales bacterium]|nr:polysaccharide ABC transporter ATP-binding protein [Anaerolineales bacterium]